MEMESSKKDFVESLTDARNKHKEELKDLPSIRLSPEQIEEIHADEYSLMLFYATRVQPLTLGEIKRKFPEPESKKAQSVLNRYVECGLVHITKDGKYYSNYPENYINYSHYKYDADLEAKKDAKVFRLMKDNTDKKEYWKEHTYFSIDSFFTPEQTKELIEMFRAIKFKAKQFSHQNSEKGSVDGLSFRRLKFYDMILSLMIVFVLGLTGFSNLAMAGNDPGGSIMKPFNIAPLVAQDIEDMLVWHKGIYAAGGGNDPGVARLLAFSDAPIVKASVAIGGGHDPGGTATDDGDVRSGGGHDPGIVDPEICREELEAVDGNMEEISLDCLRAISNSLTIECDISESQLLCEKSETALDLLLHTL